MTPSERSAHIREQAKGFPLTSQARTLLNMAACDVDLVAKELPDDVRRLVIAARVVAFSDQSKEAMKELDEASEAFADRVPWDDEPSAR